MSVYKDIGLNYARNAGADLSDKLYYLAKVDTDGDIILASAGTDSVLGAISETAAQDHPVTVQFGGIAKVIAGAAITAGARVTSDGNGKAVSTTTAGDRVCGIALWAAGAANEIIPVALVPGHIATS